VLVPPPVFKTPSPDATENADDVGKEAESSLDDVPESLTESDGRARLDTLENKGRTLWDEMLTALHRALDKATTSEERLAIVSELRAWRMSRTD
jgi:hypothetical protein